MATKHTDTCLQKVGDTEPIFVLRAQDKFAATLVRIWAQLNADHGGPAFFNGKKYEEALDLASQMEAWPVKKWAD